LLSTKQRLLVIAITILFCLIVYFSYTFATVFPRLSRLIKIEQLFSGAKHLFLFFLRQASSVWARQGVVVSVLHQNDNIF
jgi:hypothetical protein